MLKKRGYCMITFSKKLLAFSCLLIFSGVKAKKNKTHRTKKIQLLVIVDEPDYIFALNDGNGISHDPGAPRPQGSYYITNAFIFPAGTVSKRQSDFSVDKKGNPIDANDNIGMAYFLETMLQTIDFATPIVPARGTIVEDSEWRFNFRYPCHGENNIYALGLGRMGIVPPQLGKPILDFSFGVLGASGCNSYLSEVITRFNPCINISCNKPKDSDCDKKAHHTIRTNSFTAKVYLPQEGIARRNLDKEENSRFYLQPMGATVVALIKVKFEEPIVYKA